MSRSKKAELVLWGKEFFPSTRFCTSRTCIYENRPAPPRVAVASAKGLPRPDIIREYRVLACARGARRWAALAPELVMATGRAGVERCIASVTPSRVPVWESGGPLIGRRRRAGKAAAPRSPRLRVIFWGGTSSSAIFSTSSCRYTAVKRIALQMEHRITSPFPGTTSTLPALMPVASFPLKPPNRDRDRKKRDASSATVPPSLFPPRARQKAAVAGVGHPGLHPSSMIGPLQTHLGSGSARTGT